MRPFTILALVILSIPLVAARKHSDGLGQHVFAGALAGVVFYFVNSASGHIGIVYGVNPVVSLGFPDPAAVPYPVPAVLPAQTSIVPDSRS